MCKETRERCAKEDSVEESVGHKQWTLVDVLLLLSSILSCNLDWTVVSPSSATVDSPEGVSDELDDLIGEDVPADHRLQGHVHLAEVHIDAGPAVRVVDGTAAQLAHAEAHLLHGGQAHLDRRQTAAQPAEEGVSLLKLGALQRRTEQPPVGEVLRVGGAVPGEDLAAVHHNLPVGVELAGGEEDAVAVEHRLGHGVQRHEDDLRQRQLNQQPPRVLRVAEEAGDVALAEGVLWSQQNLKKGREIIQQITSAANLHFDFYCGQWTMSARRTTFELSSLTSTSVSRSPISVSR